jgi:hypothetical protein
MVVHPPPQRAVRAPVKPSGAGPLTMMQQQTRMAPQQGMTHRVGTRTGKGTLSSFMRSNREALSGTVGHKMGNGKKSKALHKIVFDDEANDMFDEEYDAPNDGGMIPEESEEEEEDRFRNKKLGPKKKKSVKK